MYSVVMTIYLSIVYFIFTGVADNIRAIDRLRLPNGALSGIGQLIVAIIILPIPFVIAQGIVWLLRKWNRK